MFLHTQQTTPHFIGAGQCWLLSVLFHSWWIFCFVLFCFLNPCKTTPDWFHFHAAQISPRKDWSFSFCVFREYLNILYKKRNSFSRDAERPTLWLILPSYQGSWQSEIKSDKMRDRNRKASVLPTCSLIYQAFPPGFGDREGFNLPGSRTEHCQPQLTSLGVRLCFHSPPKHLLLWAAGRCMCAITNTKN